MVKWTATVITGMTYSGDTEDGSWRTFSNDVKDQIISLRIDNAMAGATIDDNKDGYLIANKVIAAIQGGMQAKLVGIGYWDKPADVVRIKWYLASSMELQFTEARPTELCGLFLIKNS